MLYGRVLPGLKAEGYDLSFVGLRAQEGCKRARRVSDLFENDSVLPNCFPVRHMKARDIWAYIVSNNLPYCSHYDKYASLVGYEEVRFCTFFDKEFDKYGNSNLDGVLMTQFKKCFLIFLYHSFLNFFPTCHSLIHYFQLPQLPQNDPQTTTVGASVATEREQFTYHSDILKWISETKNKLPRATPPLLRKEAFLADPMISGTIYPYLKNVLLKDYKIITSDNKLYSEAIEEITTISKVLK